MERCSFLEQCKVNIVLGHRSCEHMHSLISSLKGIINAFLNGQLVSQETEFLDFQTGGAIQCVVPIRKDRKSKHPWGVDATSRCPVGCVTLLRSRSWCSLLRLLNKSSRFGLYGNHQSTLSHRVRNRTPHRGE